MSELHQYLDFEKPIVEIEEELEKLRQRVESGDLSPVAEVEKLERRLERVRTDVYGNLSAYQRVQLSRHAERPFTLEYIEYLTKDFQELHGDRLFADDPAVVGGICRFNGRAVMMIGHQRGRSVQERVKRNFGMPQPEGNRKAQRLFKLAEKFSLPLILFIDTQGAYPGMEAEARGQAEAIARNLYVLAGLDIPIISTVIGEGGSGGALALGVCDRLLMMENSTYSVITPEGCAAILWGKESADKGPEYARQAAESLKLTARSLQSMEVVDEVVPEPPGGAHRDHIQAAENLGEALSKHLAELIAMPIEELKQKRYEKFRRLGGLYRS